MNEWFLFKDTWVNRMRDTFQCCTLSVRLHFYIWMCLKHVMLNSTPSWGQHVLKHTHMDTHTLTGGVQEAIGQTQLAGGCWNSHVSTNTLRWPRARGLDPGLRERSVSSNSVGRKCPLLWINEQTEDKQQTHRCRAKWRNFFLKSEWEYYLEQYTTHMTFANTSKHS